MEEGTKKFWTTFVLATTPIIGWIGIHRFYLSQKFRGLFYLLFCWTGIPALISIIDATLLLYRGQDVFVEKHVQDEQESEEQESEEQESEEQESEEQESEEQESEEQESEEQESDYKGTNKRDIEPDYSDYYGDF